MKLPGMRCLTATLLLLFALQPVMVYAERLAVKASVANIRSGPGTGHDVLWRVEKYYPIDAIRRSGSWYYFRDFEGDTGWVHTSLVASITTVITAKEKANVRSGPGTKHEILYTAEKGIPFKVLKRKGRWVHLEHGDGDRGWIHNSLLW